MIFALEEQRRWQEGQAELNRRFHVRLAAFSTLAAVLTTFLAALFGWLFSR